MRVSKREGELKSEAMQVLKDQCPTFFILLQATAGAPDRAIAGNGRTSYWEFKHGTPDFETQGNQTLFCMRLAASGHHCRYVIWQENAKGFGQRTLIVHPRTIHDRTSYRVVPETFCVGFNPGWLVNYIKEAHHV